MGACSRKLRDFLSKAYPPFPIHAATKKTNLNGKLQEVNDADKNSALKWPTYQDVGGVLEYKSFESMMAEEMPAEGYSSALPIFHDGASGLHALETQVDALDLALRAAKANLKKARLLKEENMTNMLWHLMNEHKKIVETVAISTSSWCGGMYIPKPAALLVTHSARPASFSISKSFLQSIDRLFPKIKDGTINAEDVRFLDEEHAKFFSTIRQAGVAGALLKQFRGAFSSSQKREDHQHTIFVTAALREQLIYFLSTAPMAFERRVNLQQFPLPRLLVSVERFLNMDANLTVDAFRRGFSSLISGEIDQGCHTIITHKSLRVEEEGTGSKEALESLARGGAGAGAGAGAGLSDLACQELERAKSSKVKLNILLDRDDLERSQLRFGAVEWKGREGEPVTFHRGLSDMFAYAVDSSGNVVASSSATGRAPKLEKVKEIERPRPKRRVPTEQTYSDTEDEAPEYVPRPTRRRRYESDTEDEYVPRSAGGTSAAGGKSASPEFMASRAGRYLRRNSTFTPLPDFSAEPSPVPFAEREIVPQLLDFLESSMEGKDDEGKDELDGKSDVDV
jgi:hypothetical protein